MIDFLAKKKQDDELQAIKNGILRKFPLLGVTMSKLAFEPTKKLPTAATNGEKVLYNKEFIDGLFYDQKVFVFSHEIMHVAFDHIMRSKNKDPQLWNQATDAVINQMLVAEKLPMIDGGIDIKEALNKSAEEMYEKLLKQKQEQEQKNQQNNNQQNDSQDSDQNQGGQGSHDIWKDAIEKAEKQEQEKNKKDSKCKSDNQNSQRQQNNSDSQIDSDSADDEQQDDENTDSKSASMQNAEKQFSEANSKLKKKMADEIRQRLQQEKIDAGKSGSGGYESSFNGVGESKAIISWKKILKKELEKEEDRWSYRRSDEDNDYQARIGTLEVQDYPETEVMLDVSGSVDDNFLKGFLRQLKPLLKESKLKVGCFDEYVYPFIEIKKVSDIDTFKVTRKSTWTENWDAAVRAFSKKKGVNKIIFTDGCPCPGVMPKEDLSKVNVIWLVFENQNFKPCCGKVIYVNRKELNLISSKEEMIR